MPQQSRTRSRYLGAADRFSHSDNRLAAVLLIAPDAQTAAGLADDALGLLDLFDDTVTLRIADATGRDGEHALSTQTDGLREASVARLVVLPVTTDERTATAMLKTVNNELRRWRLLPELRVARLGPETMLVGDTTDREPLRCCLTRATAGWLAEPASAPDQLAARAKRAIELGAAQ